MAANVSPLAARLIKAIEAQIEEERTALERGLQPEPYQRLCGAITCARWVLDLIRDEDRRDQADDDEDDEQPALTEAA